MFLTLIGMSGSGKSHWAKQLAYEQGYRNFYCDDLIEQKIRKDVPDFPGSGIGAVARWLGFPSEPGFAEREAQYLASEAAVMEEILSTLKFGKKNSVVIDTSGSVIHTGDAVCARLHLHTTVVYLKIPVGEEAALLEQFLKDPKPVLWQGQYQPHPGEEPSDALRRCYPAMLAARSAAYESLADVTIEFPIAARTTQTTSEFLAIISQASKASETGGYGKVD